ncbi:MAG: ABC transporter permease [Methylotenera sp.]|nr:ABC transporter permease [Oligoflexia bacterium]
MNRFYRIPAAVVLVLFIFVASRALIHALPGDPLETLLAETGTHLSRELLRADLKLDEPFFVGTWHQFLAALHGDWGSSLLTRRPIGPVLLTRSLNTFLLSLTTLLIALSAALTLAFFSICRFDFRGGESLRRVVDRLCTFQSVIAAALPTPWLAPILGYVLAVRFPIFPLGNHLALPAITLSIPFSGLWARLLRDRIRETLGVFGETSGPAQAARGRGIAEWKVILKYGLAPASGSLLAYLGTQLGALMAGAFVTEIVFDWEGVGSLLVESVLKRDYPIVEAAVFITATAAVLGTFLGDWMQWKVDPRLREQG